MSDDIRKRVLDLYRPPFRFDGWNSHVTAVLTRVNNGPLR